MNQRRHALWCFRVNRTRKYFIRQQEYLDVRPQLRQQPFSPGFSRFTEEDGPEFEAAADGFFDDPHTLDGGMAIISRLALGKSLPQVFHLLVLRAADGPKAVVGIL